MEKKEIIAGVVVKKNGRYLLVQEKKSIAFGLWNFPAGHMLNGEFLEQTAIREAKEETGYDVEILRKIGTFYKEGDKIIKHAFEAKIVGGDLKYPQSEILDAQWFTLDEIKKMEDKLRSYWILESLNILKNKK